MTASITFKEISDIIEKSFNVRPLFSSNDNITMVASYKINAYLPAIEVEIHIDALRKDVICLSYNCNAATAMMISGAVSFIEGKIPSGVEINTTDKRIIIYPQRIEKISQALDYVELNSITFNQKGVDVGLNLVM